MRPIGTVWSGGVNPVSLTTRQNLLYVVNAGYFPGTADDALPGNITGFSIDDGRLSPLRESTQALSRSDSAVGPAEIAFSPDGDQLAVTEKATNVIDV